MNNQNYVIFTDSTTDLTPAMIEALGIEVLPLEFVFSDGKSYKNYPDCREMSNKDFYIKVKEGELPKTNQINVTTYTEAFEPYLKDGKDILILSFSSALSGTYQSATIAAKEMSEKYPSRKLIAIDTLSASMGEGLLVYLAVNKAKDENMTIDELAKWVEDNKLRLAHWFTVDDLNHLKRGGRVSSAAALIGTILGIKPVLHVDNEGRLIPVDKVRGRRQSLDALANKLFATIDKKEGAQMIFISHGDCEEDAKYLADKIRTGVAVKDIKINFVGPVIGTHSGPGTMALFFLATER